MELTETSRNYRDLYSYKDQTKTVMVPKYFPDEDISTLNVGLLGLITEQSGVVTEDVFNTASLLLREFFPNKASLPESVYTYAGLFQLSNAIGRAALCKFLIIMNEEELTKIFEQSVLSTGAPTNCIYISKNTTIYLEDTPFVLDYDIEITRKKTRLIKSSSWSYGAKYIINPYKNSISTITSPYIKIRKSVDGQIALEVITHQCIREETVESIIDNSSINYTTIDVPFTGVLAGFDVFYKPPGDTSYTQLDLLVVNSLPQKDPFCYYMVADENILRISFAISSSYFQPEFNSEIKIITYLSKGEDGEFEAYTGTDISIVPDTDQYSYNNNLMIAALPVSSSVGGKSSISIEELRKMVVRGFSTANALTTEHDIESYFYSFESSYKNQVKFIKRRDDLFERLYSGFLIMRNNDYIYPTNTLDIDTNYLQWRNTDGGYIYTLDPGHVFEYDGTKQRVTPIFKYGFMDKKPFINFQGQTVYEWIYRDYFRWLEIVDPHAVIGFDKDDVDWKVNWIHSKDENETFKHFVENELYTCIDCGYHTFDMSDPEEEGSMRCPVCHGTNIEKGGLRIQDFFSSVYDDDDRYAEKIANGEFLFSNPFLMSITKNPGLINYFLTIINQTSLLDFIEYNESTPLQFIINQLSVYRDLTREKEYTARLKVASSIEWDPEQLVPGITTDNYVGKRSQLTNNYLRIVLVIQSGGVDVCYLEMVPEEYNESEQFVFACKFRVNDHVTMAYETQTDDYTNDELGYIPVDPDAADITHYTFDETDISGILVEEQGYSGEALFSLESSQVSDAISLADDSQPDEEPMEDTSGIRGNFTYIENKQTKLIPMTNVVMKLVVLTKEYGVPSDKQITNNYPNDKTKFSMLGYQWTNVYNTATDKIDLIKPLSMIRSSMYFRDHRLYNVQEGDIYLYSVPFVKYSLMQHYDDDGNFIKDSTGYTNYEMFTKFIREYFEQYQHMELLLADQLKNVSHIDLKFYNTYGKSKNYLIGDADEVIDRVNMSICFYVYVVAGTDLVKAQTDLKTFIKDTIESLNKYGSNDMNISNLIRKIENNFSYVDHLKFIGINGEVSDGEYKKTDTLGYSTDYQTIRNITTDLDDLDKDERFAYVPEMLCINKDQISLVMFEA